MHRPPASARRGAAVRGALRRVSLQGLGRWCGVVLVAGLGVAVAAVPASAQQLVDASGENGGGGLAFVLLVVTMFIMGAGLFFMDRVRRSRMPEDDEDHR
jgi:hypothetical protein